MSTTFRSVMFAETSMISVVVTVLATVFVVAASLVGGAAAAPPFPVPTFNCPTLPDPGPATDVNSLKPGHIKVVMALGDSISAGFAMVNGNPVTDFLEWRGRVFSIGGDDGALTVPNFLKTYSPSVTGMAFGKTIPLTKGQYLDAAVSEAKIQDVPPQVAYLISTLRNDSIYKDVDFDNDWKMLNILIGANNLCSACHGGDSGNPDFYEDQLRNVLKLVRGSIPRVLVNIVSLFNISQVYTVGIQTDYCKDVFKLVTECGCLTGSDEDRQKMDDAKPLFNERIEKVAAEFRALQDPTFTVNVQPYLKELAVPSESFLSKLDCFHPSVYADEAFALGLWKSMFLPWDKKPTTIDPEHADVYCPTADDYFQ